MLAIVDQYLQLQLLPWGSLPVYVLRSRSRTLMGKVVWKPFCDKKLLVLLLNHNQNIEGKEKKNQTKEIRWFTFTHSHSSSLSTFSDPHRPCEAEVGVSGVLARGHHSPVLGQHRQPLQQDGDHRLVKVRSGGQRLQVHLLLGHLLRVGLLVLHRPLETASRSTAWWQCVSLHFVQMWACVHCLTCRFSVRPNSAWGFSDTCGTVSESGHTCSLHSPVHQPPPPPLAGLLTHSCACLHRLLSISVIWETDRESVSLQQRKLWPAGLIWPTVWLCLALKAMQNH